MIGDAVAAAHLARTTIGTLKLELVNHERYATHAGAKNSIFEYIEVFYNRKRMHSTLGYVSPVEFEIMSA